MYTFQSIIHNTFFGVLSNLLNRVTNTLLFILVIQRISIGNAGIYDLGFSYFLIFSRVALLGLGQLLIRDVVADLSQIGKYVTNFIFIRMLLTLAIFIISSLFIISTNYDQTTKLFIIIMLIGIFPENVNELCRSIYVAFEDVHLDSITTLINGLIKLVVGIFFIIRGYDLYTIALIILLGHISTMSLNMILIKKRYIKKWRPIELDFLKKQILPALPFIVIGTFYIIDNRIDKILISFLSNDEEIGIYGAATAIYFALTMFAESYRTAILPIMSRYKHTDAKKLQTIYIRSYKILLIIGLPLALCTLMVSDKIILILYQRPLPVSVDSLQIMGATLGFAFINALNTRLLLVFDQHHLTARFFLIATATNFIVLLWLIPSQGAIGAATGTATSVLVRFGLLTRSASHIISIKGLIKYSWRLALSITTMGMILWLTSSLSIWYQIIASSIGYIFMLLLTQTLSPEEQSLFIQYSRNLYLKATSPFR